MLEAFNTNTWMVAAYIVVAALACLTGLREQSVQRTRHASELLPVFWFLTSALFISMAIAHAGELGGAAADYARSGAYADGWYESRRSIQVVVVAVVAVLWALATLVALWRIPERRRRYPPDDHRDHDPHVLLGDSPRLAAPCRHAAVSKEHRGAPHRRDRRILPRDPRSGDHRLGPPTCAPDTATSARTVESRSA